MRLSIAVIISAFVSTLFAGCATSSAPEEGDRGGVTQTQNVYEAPRVVDHFSLPCRSVQSTIQFHRGTFVAMLDGCKQGVVQNGLYVRKYDGGGTLVKKTNLIFPEVKTDTPLEGGNQPRTWIDDMGGLNWLSPLRKLNCLAYSRLPDPASAKGFFENSSSICLEDKADISGTNVSVWANLVRLRNGNLYLHAGKRGALFVKTGDSYQVRRSIDPQITHKPSVLGERFDNVWACVEGLSDELLCQARFYGGDDKLFGTRSANDDTGLAVLDVEANRMQAFYQRGTTVFSRLVASPKGLLVSAANGGPRQLAWTVVDSSGRLVYDDKTDKRGIIPIEKGPEWGYGTPAFSPDGAWLYVIRSDKLLDVFSTEPFERRTTLNTTQLGIRQIGFVAVDKTNGHVAICGDKDCAVIQGWK